jgi:rhamnosyltransferase
MKNHELNRPKVAVLLAVYNGMQNLSEQVDSILGQVEVDVALVVSVDRSSDGCEDWFNCLSMDDPRVNVLPHGQRFGGAARNFFRLLRDVDLDQFDYVAFADQDDLWFPEKLSRAHQLLVEFHAACYSSNVLAFWPSGRQVLIDKAQSQRPWDFLFEAAGPGCTYVMNTAFVMAVQARLAAHWADVQEVALHDWFVYAFARANGYRWVIDERPGMLYRQHEVNQVGANSGWRAFRYRVVKILNGWGLRQAELIASIVGVRDTPFVDRWLSNGRFGLLWLALNATSCRRRRRDQMMFMTSCLLLSLFPGSGK